MTNKEIYAKLKSEVIRILLYDHLLSSREVKKALKIGRFESEKSNIFTSHLSAEQIAERLVDNLKFV